MMQSAIMRPEKFYRLPIQERFVEYRKLYGEACQIRTVKVRDFLDAHGGLSPAKQLQTLMPSVKGEHTKRVATGGDALCYEVSIDDMRKIGSANVPGYFVTGMIVERQNLLAARFRHLVGCLAITTKASEDKHPALIVSHELDHLRNMTMPAYEMAELNSQNYLDLLDPFARAYKKATGEKLGLFNGSIFVSDMKGNAGGGGKSAPKVAHEIANALIGMLAYQMLFETSAVLRSFMPQEATSGLDENGMGSLLEEIKSCSKNGQFYGFNLSFLRNHFPRDTKLVQRINAFEKASTRFLFYIANSLRNPEAAAMKTNILAAHSSAMQLLTHEEIEISLAKTVYETIAPYEQRRAAISIVNEQ